MPYFCFRSSIQKGIQMKQEDNENGLDIHLSGKWRFKNIDLNVPKRDLKIGEFLLSFMQWHTEVGGGIYTNARHFILNSNMSREQEIKFYEVLSMYIHKYARK